MFSYVDFGFMLDFIVFIMRSLVEYEVLEMLEVIKTLTLNSSLSDRGRVLFTNTQVPQLIPLCPL